MLDELELVRRFRAREEAPSEDTVKLARAALDDAIAAKPSRPRPPRRLPAGRRPARTWGFRVAAVAVACAATLVAVWPFGSASGPGVSSALAATLNRLAGIAASGTSLVPSGGRYLYLNSVNDWASDAYAGKTSCLTYARQHRQVWVNAQRSGLLLETDGPVQFTSAGDKARCQAMKPSPLPAVGQRGGWTLWFAPNCWSLGPTNDLAALSRNPRTLLAQMRRIDGGPRTAGEDFVHIGDFLRETDASPALRAAIYRAAALIPGVRLLGTARDRLGRTGLGVAFFEHGRKRSELIFNARTAALMAEYDGGGGWAMYYPSKLVSRPPAPAPIPLRPGCVNGGGYIKHTPAGDVQVGGPGLKAGPAPVSP